MNARLRSLIFIALALGLGAAAQSSPDAVRQAERDLQQWRESNAAAWAVDFGNLSRYRDANTKLGPPTPGENRVVFMGDSITDSWDLAKYFPGKPYVNRGISGQTTPQMLIRFREDVINLQPKVVVILAGTNDIAGNTGPMTLAEIEANYASMAELARANGIRVVLASVTPVNCYTEKAQKFFPLRPPEKIRELNLWLKNYAANRGYTYLDYFSAMVDEQGLLKRNLSQDGLHPNVDGYTVMMPLAEKAIENTLNAPAKVATAANR